MRDGTVLDGAPSCVLASTHPWGEGETHSLREAVANRLRFACVVDVDSVVRAAMATAAWLESDVFGAEDVAFLLVHDIYRDVRP